jgi:predicted TIM-barrel fold metal-dependent hydrolase
MEIDVTEANIEAETRFATSLPAPVIGAIAACRPEAGDFETQFDRLNAIPNVQGFRHILHTSPDELSQSEHFAQNVRHISKAGKPFDLTVLARQLPIPLVERCPDTQFILDHCSVPDVARQALDPWRGDIKAMARLPNVAVKLSGIIAHSPSM